jgi:hypothetical protein
VDVSGLSRVHATSRLVSLLLLVALFMVVMIFCADSPTAFTGIRGSAEVAVQQKGVCLK